MKLPRNLPPGWVRLFWWTNAGAQTTTVPLSRATEERYRLIAGGAVVYHSEVFP